MWIASSCLKEGSCLIFVICVSLCIVVFNTYSVVFLICFSSSCIPYVASFFGLSIFDCRSVFIYSLFIRPLYLSALLKITTSANHCVYSKFSWIGLCAHIFAVLRGLTITKSYHSTCIFCTLYKSNWNYSRKWKRSNYWWDTWEKILYCNSRSK
jgi:hypothetical protein